MIPKYGSAAILPLLVCAGAASAAVQSGIDQIGDSHRATASVVQIPAPASTIESEAISPSPDAPGESQLVESAESREPVPQLTRDPGTRPPTQLYRGGPTAQPTEALSRPADGRRSAVVRIEGQDRCDPAAEDGGERRVCRQVIETRAAEFAPHEQVLSVEQRLLVDQRVRDQAGTAEAAARRLAERGGDPDSPDEQGIAFIVMTESPAPPDAGADGEVDQYSPVTDAIVGGLIGVPPQ